MYRGKNWREEETRTFLDLCIEKQIILLMDRKKTYNKHINVFHSLVKEMKKKGFLKTARQMSLKLQNLKFAYFKCKRKNSDSDAAKTTCPFYDQLDILYSNQPNTQVLHDASGIDTANIQDESLSEYTDDSVTNDSDISEESESNSSTYEPPTKKKRGLNKFSGRKSYETILDKYTKDMIQSQKEFLTDIIIKQNNMQKEMIKVEMENQRLWEKEIMEKEHAFQKEQMQSFIQAMQAIAPSSQAPSSNYEIPQNFLMPQNYELSTNYLLPQNIKIIPINQGNIIGPS